MIKPDASPCVQICINIDAVCVPVDIAVRRALSFANWGLKAPAEVDLSAPLPGTSFGLTTDGPPETAVTRDAYEAWVIGCAFQYVAESFGFCLDSARELLVGLGLMGQPITPKKLQQAIKHEGAKFHGMGLPEKFGYLAEQHRFPLAAEWKGYIQSINKARNCLVHRRGIVGQKDCGDGDKLRAEWTQMQPIWLGSGGERPALPGVPSRPGESLAMRRVTISRETAIGSRLNFTTQDLNDICMTYWLAATTIRDELKSRARGASSAPADSCHMEQESSKPSDLSESGTIC